MGEEKKNRLSVPMIVLGAVFLALYGVVMWWNSLPGAMKMESSFGVIGLLGVILGIACRKKENPGKVFRFVYAVEIFYASMYFITIFSEVSVKVYYNHAGLSGLVQASLVGTLLFPVLDAIFPLLALWTSGTGTIVAAVLGHFLMRLSQLSVTWTYGKLDGLAVFWFFVSIVYNLMFIFCIIWVAESVKKAGRDRKCKAIGTLAAMGNGVALELVVSLVINPLLSWVLEGEPYWRFSWLYIVFPIVLCLVISGDILLFRWLKRKKSEVICLSPEAVHGQP